MFVLFRRRAAAPPNAPPSASASSPRAAGAGPPSYPNKAHKARLLGRTNARPRGARTFLHVPGGIKSPSAPKGLGLPGPGAPRSRDSSSDPAQLNGFPRPPWPGQMLRI